MNAVDSRTTRKDNNQYQTTNIIYDQNTMSVTNKIITKSSNSHQMIPEGNNLTYNSLEKICNWLTGRQKRANVSILENK